MEILVLPQIPKSMVVIGAGAVGVEFGSIFKSFGSEITIVEYLPRLVPNEDEDVSKELARVFRKRGIDTHTGAKVEKVEKTKDGVKVTFTGCGRQAGGEGSGEGAGGRRPRPAHRRSSAWRPQKLKWSAASSASMSGCKPGNPASSPSAT